MELLAIGMIIVFCMFYFLRKHYEQKRTSELLDVMLPSGIGFETLADRNVGKYEPKYSGLGDSESTSESQMKIKKKQTVFITENGMHVEQGAWRVLTDTLIQCEFNFISILGNTNFKDGFDGALGVFLSDKIDRVRFLLTPVDIFEDNRPQYEDMTFNFVKCSGSFMANDNTAFTHNLEVVPEFETDEGWCFEFDSATSKWAVEPHEFDHIVSAEKVVADMVCSNSFSVSIGRRYASKQGNTVDQIFACVELGDIEELRLAIADVLGTDYVNKLLRRNGYEIDS